MNNSMWSQAEFDALFEGDIPAEQIVQLATAFAADDEAKRAQVVALLTRGAGVRRSAFDARQ